MELILLTDHHTDSAGRGIRITDPEILKDVIEHISTNPPKQVFVGGLNPNGYDKPIDREELDLLLGPQEAESPESMESPGNASEEPKAPEPESPQEPKSEESKWANRWRLDKEKPR